MARDTWFGFSGMARCLVVAGLCAFAADAAAQKRGLVGALLGAGAGAAAASSRSGPEPAKTYGPSDLRPEALKTCLVTAYKLDESEEEMGKSSKALDSEAEGIKKNRAALERDSKKDFPDQAQVDKFNARVDAHKVKVAAYNKKINDYEARRVARGKDVDTFNKGCAGKRYYTSDLASIQSSLPFDPAKYAAKK